MNILIQDAIMNYSYIHLLGKYFFKPHNDPCFSSCSVPNCNFQNTNTHTLTWSQLIAMKPMTLS